MTTKVCTKCKVEKPFEAFGPAKDKGAKFGLHSWCHGCLAADQQRRRDADPDYAKKANLRVRYGMTLEDWQALYDAQGGACAICGKVKEVLHVDHDHRCCPGTKKSCGKCVRGLICYPCNLFLGRIESAYAAPFFAYLGVEVPTYPITRSEHSSGERGRPRKTHCPHGHEFTPENTYQINGRRRCRICRRETQRRMRATP